MVSAERVGIVLVSVMIASLLAVALFVTGRVESRKAAAGQRRFPAASYRWTRACPSSAVPGVAVRRACIRTDYRLGSVWTLGLDGGRSHDWYRIGNDAVDVDCPRLDRAAACTIRRIARDKFVAQK